MKPMFSVKSIPLLAAALLVPLVILAQTSGNQKTVTGIVSDAMCGSAHMMKDKPAAECLRYCVKRSSQAKRCTRLKGTKWSSTNTRRRKSQ